jgi:fructokinase
VPDSPIEAYVVGEALIDLIRRPGEPETARVGGSPVNVAIGLSRLDIPVELQTHIGTDDHGVMIARHLAANDVRLVDGSVTDGPTSTAVATITEDGSATYEFDLSWSLGAVGRRTPALVHTGSIGAVLEPGAAVVVETIRALRDVATISYDPNVRPQLMGDRATARARIESLIALADVVKASDEDVAWLYPGIENDEVARRWLELGPALVVLTRGGSGAYAVTAGAAVEVLVPPTTVADTIGAGDSFMAGLLAALVDADLVGRYHDVAVVRVLR